MTGRLPAPASRYDPFSADTLLTRHEFKRVSICGGVPPLSIRAQLLAGPESRIFLHFYFEIHTIIIEYL